MISSPSGTLNSSPPNAINIACDPMQNPGQNRIFYKVGQTQMTRQKRDPNDSDDPTWFQPWHGLAEPDLIKYADTRFAYTTVNFYSNVDSDYLSS